MLSIRNAEVERLARKLAQEQRGSMTEAILEALRIRAETDATRAGKLAEGLAAIAASCAALPDLDSRGADEILGYDDVGRFGDGGR